MGKNPVLKILKKQVETAEGWLRLLREHPLPNMAHVVYCPRCDRPRMFGPLPAGEDISKCWHCRELVLLLDGSFFSALSKFLKYSYRKDRSLFARVKAELSDVSLPKSEKVPDSSSTEKPEVRDSSFPNLEGVLAWIKKPWEKATNPRGKPQEIRKHLFIASWIESLAASRFVLDVKTDGSPTPRRLTPLMSFVDALDVLRGDYPPVGRTLYIGKSKRKFGGLDSDSLRQIHEEFKKRALEEFRVIPSLATREVQRIMKWYRRWPEAKHRIQGNRVREK